MALTKSGNLKKEKNNVPNTAICLMRVVVRCMYLTLPLAAKYRHVILHCICLVKLIEHMLILVQFKWSSAYQIQCPIHLVSIRVLTKVCEDDSI